MHGVPQAGGEDGGIAPDLSYAGLMRDERWIHEHFTQPAGARAGLDHAVVPVHGRANSADESRIWPAEDGAAGGLRRRGHLQGAVRAVPRREGRRHWARSRSISTRRPRDLTKAAFMNEQAAGAVRRVDPAGRGGDVDAAVGQGARPRRRCRRLLDYVFATFVKASGGAAEGPRTCRRPTRWRST